MYEIFLQYLKEKPSFKSGRCITASAKKYADAIIIISDEMVEDGVIEICLYNIIDVCRLDRMIVIIMNNESFIAKNERGNKMYSNALEHYQYFRHNSHVGRNKP